MEVGLVYSSKDPRQALTREFVVNFLSDRGVLAEYTEFDQPVEVPVLTVNGRAVRPSGSRKDRIPNGSRFPSLEDITKALERGIWCL